MSLRSLAEQINTEADLAQQSLATGAEHARRCGELLLQAKALVPHGEWGRWLGENFTRSERTAQVCMQLAKAQTSAGLSIAAALTTITASSPLRDAIRATNEWYEAANANLESASDLAAINAIVSQAHELQRGWAEFKLRVDRDAGQRMAVVE